MERYSNGRSLLRQGGRFAKQPTLEQMGLPVAKGGMKCICGHEWTPILTTGICPKCGSQDKVPNTALSGWPGKDETETEK